ncbi:MAG: peroxiredoxin [Chloroflexi bacterium]|nr:MAG: peroxiredoxin [Chloroflexota bacterium]
MPLGAGDRAPAFSLTDDEGHAVSNETLRGKRYVLYFYPKDDTPGCTTEACQFNDNLSQFQRLNVPVIGVSADSAATHRSFKEKYDLHFPLLTDADRKTHQAYGAWGERPGRGVGVIRSTFVVDEQGKIKRAWYGVRPDGHASEVLSALAQ